MFFRKKKDTCDTICIHRVPTDLQSVVKCYQQVPLSVDRDGQWTYGTKEVGQLQLSDVINDSRFRITTDRIFKELDRMMTNDMYSKMDVTPRLKPIIYYPSTISIAMDGPVYEPFYNNATQHEQIDVLTFTFNSKDTEITIAEYDALLAKSKLG